MFTLSAEQKIHLGSDRQRREAFVQEVTDTYNKEGALLIDVGTETVADQRDSGEPVKDTIAHSMGELFKSILDEGVEATWMCVGGWYDVVVAMYHDQGHIPLKVKGFVYSQELGTWEAVKGVNITLGLPIIRTSVDHGTGYDRAGDGSALELSLLNAIEYAIQMALAKEQR